MSGVEKAMAGGADGLPEVVIEPEGSAPFSLSELWSYRGLLIEMSLRGLRARYQQTALGKVWLVLQPLLLLGVYYFVFALVLGFQTESMPFWLFLLSGLLVWQVFSGTLSAASGALEANSHLIGTVYFPRLIIPFSTVLAQLFDFGLSAVVLVVLMVVTGHPPGLAAPLALGFVLLASGAGLGIGLLLAPLVVEYRDLRNLVPLMLQVMMYLSPVFYPPSIVPSWAEPVVRASPMAVSIQGFRWALVPGADAPGLLGLIGVGIALAALVAGAIAFKRTEAAWAERA